MKILLIGSFLESNDKILPQSISIAGNSFQKRLLEYFKDSKYISIIYLNSKEYNFRKELKNSQVVCIEKRFIFFDIFNMLIVFSRTIMSSKNHHIIFYNLDIPNLILLIFCRFFRLKCSIIIADWSSPKFLKSIQKGIINSKIFKVISLRKLPHIKSKRIMPGIWTKKMRFEKKDQYSVLLSGSLGNTTGLFVALEAFNSPYLADYQLNLSGKLYKLSNEEKIRFENILKRSNNIIWHGTLSHEKYQHLLDKCSYGLSLRNPEDLQHTTNFPSKIIEYSMNGMWVVTSKNYNEFDIDSLVKCSFNSSSLSNEILKLKFKILNLHKIEKDILELCNPNKII